MSIDFIGLILGLALSYKIVTASWRQISIEKLLAVTFGLYISLETVIGFGLDHFGLPLSYSGAVFAAILSMFFLAGWKMTGTSVLDIRGLGLSVLVLLIAFLIYLYPSLPYLSPSCFAGDCETHYVYVQYIYDMDSLEHGVNYGYSDLRIYPFGFHLNAALLARAFGVPPIIMMQPFLALIIALTILSSYGITKSVIGNNRIALLTPAFLLLSVYPASLLGIGFWAQALGIFLAVLFVLVLVDYSKSLDRGRLLILMILQAAMMFTYNVVSAVTLATFLIVALARNPLRVKAGHVLLFLAFTGGFMVQYMADMGYDVCGVERGDVVKAVIAAFEYQSKWLFTDGMTIRGDLNSLGFHLVLLGFAGALATVKAFLRRKNRTGGVPFVFFLVSFGQFAAAYALVTANMNFGPYWFHKNGYLFIYPLAIFAVVGLDWIIQVIKTTFSSKMQRLLALLIVFTVVAVLINLKTIDPFWMSKQYGPFDSFTATYRNIDYPVFLIEDQLRYDRTGNIPALYDAALWIKEHRNCSKEPCQGEIYYTGPYDATWLYGMSRSRILVEGDENCMPLQGLGPLIPAGDILYHKDKVYLYRNATKPDSRILPIYRSRC